MKKNFGEHPPCTKVSNVPKDPFCLQAKEGCNQRFVFFVCSKVCLSLHPRIPVPGIKLDPLVIFGVTIPPWAPCTPAHPTLRQKSLPRGNPAHLPCAFRRIQAGVQNVGRVPLPEGFCLGSLWLLDHSCRRRTCNTALVKGLYQHNTLPAINVIPQHYK